MATWDRGGAQDDLGFAHWLGTDYFTGMLLNYMDSDGNKVRWQPERS